MDSFVLLGSLALYIYVRAAWSARARGDEWLFAIIAAAAALRVAVGIINQEMGPLPGAEIDAVAYSSYGREIAAAARAGEGFTFEFGRFGYASMLAVFHLLGGDSYLIPTFVNAVFFVEFLLIAYGLASDWGGIVAARAVVLVAAFYPTAVIYTSVALREAPLLFGLALYVSALARYLDGRAPLASFRLLAGFALMVWLHDGFALALGLVPITLWFRYPDHSWVVRSLALGVGGLLAMAVFWKAAGLFQKLPSNPLLLFDPAFLVEIRARKTSYGVGYGVISPSWGSVLSAIPIILLGFIASPFPFWIRGGADMIKAVEGVLSLTLAVGAIVLALRMAGGVTRNRIRWLAACFIFLVAVFSIGTGNTGIAARHRAKFVWMSATVVAVAFATRRRNDAFAGVDEDDDADLLIGAVPGPSSDAGTR